MNELVPNPDNCSRFEPNPFKREKCKNCGRPWTEHKGVIDQEYLNAFVSSKQKSLEDQRQKEADAKEKARAKALAKKRSTQAVEDEWFFDGLAQDTQARDSDSDDDMGFQCFIGSDIPEAYSKTEAVRERQTVVKNLIDFSACDVADLPEDRTSNIPYAAAPLQRSAAAEEEALSYRPNAPPGAVHPSSFPVHPLFGATDRRNEAIEEELLSEIHHLRQMLADASEEKNIQVAIVQDEVAEKQQHVEQLMRQCRDVDAKLRNAIGEMQMVEARAAQFAIERDEMRAREESRRAEAESARAEAQQLQAEVKERVAKLVEKQQRVDQLEQQLLDAEASLRDAQEKASAQEAHAVQIANEREEALSQVERLQAEVAELQVIKLKANKLEDRSVANDRDESTASAKNSRAEAELARAEAQHLQAEVERLQTQLTNLEANKEPAETAVAKGAAPMEEEAQAHSAEPIGTIAELRELCLRTREVLGGQSLPREEAPGSTGACSLQAELRRLRDDIVSVHAEAERATTDHRKLEAQLREMEKLQSAALPAELPPQRRAHAANGRHEALAIKDIRVKTEQKLALIKKRLFTQAMLAESSNSADPHLRGLQC